MRTRPLPLLARTGLLASLVLLSGCELQIPGMGPSAAAVREAESKAIGGACRHALRGLEDCYTLNPKASKSAIFEGWREMDLYMRENKIDGAPSVIKPPEKPAKPARREPAEET
ncbi:hypothetical protein [Acidovorax lacteus]|uniref:Uncharacterized protein n=1 Tax=Acidovorax lacteus TaxID=1924988 RepID=A0ABP8LJC7_9BURK